MSMITVKELADALGFKPQEAYPVMRYLVMIGKARPCESRIRGGRGRTLTVYEIEDSILETINERRRPVPADV